MDHFENVSTFDEQIAWFEIHVRHVILSECRIEINKMLDNSKHLPQILEGRGQLLEESLAG